MSAIDETESERYECPTCSYATNNYDKFIKHGETHRTSGDGLASVMMDLRSRMEAANTKRTPGGVQPDGVYWNGFYSGMQVAIELLKRR